jgi:hypothetical protein
METSPRRVFFEHDEFLKVWNRKPSRSAWLGRERARPELVSEAAHFLAGAMLRHGFHLFQNGGVPLLERRNGDLLEEIVLRPGPFAMHRGQRTIPVAVQLHLSHSRIASVRRRYWRPGSRAPQSVASGDIGELELPPCWVVWNLDAERSGLPSLVEWAERLAIPWFDGFHHSIELHGRLQEGCVPLVRTDTALELMLAHYGQVEASLFLERRLRDQHSLAVAVNDEMKRLRFRCQPLGFENNVAHNLAVVASSFCLLSGSSMDSFI